MSYLMCGCILLGLLYLIWLVDVRSIYVPDEGESSVFVVRKSISGHVVRGHQMIVSVVGSDGRQREIVTRIVGKPGEDVSVRNGRVFVDNKAIEEDVSARCSFIVSRDATYKQLHSMERVYCDYIQVCDTISMRLNEIKPEWNRLLRVPILDNIPDVRVYPYLEETHWNAYNMGPIHLPERGDEMVLNDVNVAIYGELVRRFEGTEVTADGSKYKFKESYVWAMCDNRDVMDDSRAYGPIPYSNVIGIATARLW